jgi:hypothetical protein
VVPSGELTDDCRSECGNAKRLYISDTCKLVRQELITDAAAYPLMLVMFVIRENGT